MVVLASFIQPIDGIRHRQNNTTVYVNDNNLGKGTLYIAESRLSWVSDSGSGFSIEYPHISLHAVSRDLSAFPQECLFLMLDTALGDENERNGEGEDEDIDEDDDQETTELRLVPDDRGMLDAMFHAMNACQALHPDPEDSFSDEDFYEDADDEIPMEETGSRMASLCIENMENRGYIFGNELRNGRGMDTVEDTEEDTEEDMEMGEEEMVGVGESISDRDIWGPRVGEALDMEVAAGGSISGRGTSGLLGAGAGVGRLSPVRVEGAGDTKAEAVGVGTSGTEVVRVDGAGDTQAEAVRAVGISGTVVGVGVGGTGVVGVDGAADTHLQAVGAPGTELEEVRAEGTLGREAVQVVGTLGREAVGVDGARDTEVRAVGTLGREGVRRVGTLCNWGPNSVEAEQDRIVCTGFGTVQDGRSFSSGSIWLQRRMARFPPALPHQMNPEEESNFADAEN